MINLKPCPYCGGEAGVIPDSIKYPSGDCEKIYCVKCYVCSSGTTFFFFIEDAIEQWNERYDNAKSKND